MKHGKICKRAGIFSLLFIFVLSFISYAQEKKDPNKISIIEQRIEMIAEDNEDENIDYTTLFDELMLFYENPLDLNSAPKEQLQSLSLLNEVQINNLLNHIKKNGKLIAIYELQAIDGFDSETIALILPFVKVSESFDSPKVSISDLLTNSNSEFVFRDTRIVEQMEGFKSISDSLLTANPNSRYLGSPDKLFARYRFKYKNNISIGITAEKDAGEEFFKGTQKQGFDFYSAHFFLKGFGHLKHFVVGDYVLQFGQGLTMWSTRAQNKSADVLNIKRNPAIIKPFTSVNENALNDAYMRGVASTYSIKKFYFTGFLSKNSIDASVSEIDSSSGEVIGFSGASSPGLHRTPREVAIKNNVALTTFGGHIAYKGKQFEIGLTGAQLQFSANYQPDIKIYNQFRYETSTNLRQAIGIDYNYVVRNLNFFGEAARSENGGMAQIHGALIALDPRLSAVIAYRNYERNYQYLFVNPFREQTSVSANEQGTYFGLVGNLFKNVTLSGYIDKYKFPWLTASADAPSQGQEYLVQLTYKPSKTMEFFIRYRNETKEFSTIVGNSKLDQLTEANGQSIRLNAAYKVSESIKLRSRAEVKKINQSSKNENGFLIYQDIIYSTMKSPLSVTLRYALFDTPSYATGIWAYENDVLYSYFIRAHYYRGSRIYVLIHYKLFRNLELWVRWAETYYTNRNEHGSGLDKIIGPAKTEVKAQVRYKF